MEEAKAIHGEKNMGTFHTGYGNLADQGKPLKYFITNFTNDIHHHILIQAIERAIDRWNARVKLDIVRFFDPDFSVKADWFEIKFVSGSEMINVGALAEAQRGIVRINDDWFWAVEPEPEPRNLEYVLTHELGHTIFGMLHGCGGLMEPRYRDVRPDINDCTIHDAIMDHGENDQWATDENYRNEKQAYWDTDLNLATTPILTEAIPSENSVVLNWTNEDKGRWDLDSYSIIIDGVDTGETWKVDKHALTQTVTGLKSGRQYCFKIRAYYVGRVITSFRISNEICVTILGTTPPEPPTDSCQGKLDLIMPLAQQIIDIANE